MRHRLPTVLTAAFAVVFTFASAARAQYVWDGGLSHGNFTFNNNWSTPNNWIGQAPPPSGANTDITFTQSGQWTTASQNIANPFLLHSLTIDSNNTNFSGITGSALDFHTNSSSSFPSINQNSATNVSISNNINMTNSLTIGGNGSGSLTLSGVFGGAGSLTTTGTNVILTGTSSNMPVVTASSGSLTFSGGSASITGSSLPLNSGLGSSPALLTINNGASVNVPSTDSNAGITVAGPAGTAMVVDGATTKLNSGSYIVVGFGSGGQGQLTVQNGATVTETTQSLEVGTFAGDNGQVLIQSGGAITTTNVICGVLSGSAGTITVTGAGSKLTVTGSTLLSFNNGSAHLVVANGASAAFNSGVQFGQDPSVLTINGGAVTTPSITAANPASATVQVSDPVGGPALTISPGGATTYAGAITDAAGGPGTVVKTGTGTLTLTGHLTNTGGYTASKGTIDFSGDVVQPGTGSLTAASGATIRYDNGARVFGGFLLGPGTHLVNGASFTGTSASNSAVISVTGAAAFTNFSNGGNISMAAGLTAVPGLASFINQGSGSIAVGAGSMVTAADFQTYGLLNINAGPDVNHLTLLTNAGTSPLNFNGGSRTFIGVPPPPGQFSNAAIDLNGKNAIVAGGLFVNNGYVVDSSNSGAGTATIVSDFGALVKGSGFFQNTVITQNGGKLQAGNSPGSAAFGKFIVGHGGVDNYVFAIDDATGTAGPSPDAAGHVSGWSLIKSVQQVVGSATTSGDFVWTATSTAKLTVAIDTLINPTTVGIDVAGPMADFDPTQSFVWPAMQWSGTYSGPTDAAVLNADTAFDTSGFLNPVAGTFGWNLDAEGQTLSLTYTPMPVPEPGTLALFALAGVGLAFQRWRGRKAGLARRFPIKLLAGHPRTIT